jgi:epidermal growth factor receptor substrate 15
VCQLGKDPSLAVVTLADPPPRLVGIDGSTIAGFAQKKWTIEPEERLRYDKMFQGLSPAGGKLSGDKARPMMMASKLPVDALGKIWNLSDIDRDGQLDGDEFAVAMRLIQLCQAGEFLPPSLPPSLSPTQSTQKCLCNNRSLLHIANSSLLQRFNIVQQPLIVTIVITFIATL